jgi:hypothetical protein
MSNLEDIVTIWTPAQALTRIDQVDAQVKIMSDAVAHPTSHFDQDSSEYNQYITFVTAWNIWSAGWKVFAEKMRDSWFERGYGNTRVLIDGYEKQLFELIEKGKNVGIVYGGPSSPIEPESNIGAYAITAGVVIGLGLLGYAGYKAFGFYKRNVLHLGEVELSGCRFNAGHAKRAGHKLRVNFKKRGFTPSELAKGMNVEREHRNITHCNPTMTAKIALAHLYERPDYYKRLKKVEG